MLGLELGALSTLRLELGAHSVLMFKLGALRACRISYNHIQMVDCRLRGEGAVQGGGWCDSLNNGARAIEEYLFKGREGGGATLNALRRGQVEE